MTSMLDIENNKAFSEQIRDLSEKLRTFPNNSFDAKKLLQSISSRPENCTVPHDDHIRETLFENEFFELVLVKWGAQSETPIHGHPNQECYMRILKGEILQKTFKPFSETLLQETKPQENDIVHINDNMCFHAILGSGKVCLSLHLYINKVLGLEI